MKTARRILAGLMLVGGVIMWPISALTWAKDEPQFVLGLSFLALIYEGLNALQIAADAA